MGSFVDDAPVSYLAFVRRNARFLAFGMALTAFSSFGQTFFIAMFNERWQEEFSLTHGTIGLLYFAATLASGVTLIRVGRMIDHVDLRVYTVAISAGLIVACMVMASVWHVAMLAVAFFLLRLFGQGLLGHAAMTSMARYYEATRGRAISIAMLGYPIGEAILPAIGVVLLARLTWRESWALCGAVLAVTLIPIVLWLLAGHGARHRSHLETLKAMKDTRHAGRSERTPLVSWTRGQVLRDPRFYCIVPAAVAPPFLGTGVFFHQIYIVENRGWSLAWWAACFTAYAAAKVPFTILTGPLIDRYRAHRVMPFVLLPLGLGLLLLALSSHPASALVFMVLTGVTVGMSGTTTSALWAEVYGLAHLGAVRALASSVMVFSTALSPFLMGWLIDRGVSLTVILLLGTGYVVLATLLVAAAFRKQH